MTDKKKKKFPRPLRALAAFFGLVVLALALLVGRLMYGPITFTTLSPYIAQLLSQPHNGVKASVANSMLSWDRDRRSFLLDLGNTRFTSEDGQLIAVVPQIIVLLNPLGYFDNEQSPWSVAIRRPQFYGRFDEAGEFRLGMMGGDENLPAAEASPKEMDVEAARRTMQKMIRTPHLSASGLGLISNLRVDDAVVKIADDRRQSVWAITMPLLSLKRVGDDYSGKAEMNIAKGDVNARFDFNLEYRAEPDRFYASWTFSQVNPALFTGSFDEMAAFNVLSSPLTGMMRVVFDDTFTVYEGSLDLALDQGQIQLADFYKAPLDFKSGKITAHYDRERNIINLDAFEFALPDTVLKGSAEIGLAEPRNVKLSAELADLQVEKLPTYWPEDAGVNPRAWILENIHNGKVDKATVNIDVDIDANDIADWKKVEGAIDVSGTDLRYWGPLPVLNKVTAKSTYTISTFEIDVLEGEIGAVKLKPSHVTITGLNGTNQIMTLAANIHGPARDILKILDREPLKYAEKMSVKPENVSGQGEGLLKMSFALLKALEFDDITLEAQTRIKNGAITRMADLFSVDSADIVINVDKENLKLEGKGNANGIPVDMNWHELFSPPEGKPYSTGIFKAVTKADAVRKFGVDFAIESSAAFPITVNYERFPDVSRLGVKADAKNPQLDIPDVFFSKPAGTPVTIDTQLEWGGGKPMRLSRLNMVGANIDVKGQGSFDAGGQSLTALTFDPVKFDGTDLRFELKRVENVPTYIVTGEALDLRKALAPTPAGAPVAAPTAATPAPAKKAPTPLAFDIKLKRILTGPANQLDDVSAKGERDSNGWNTLNMALRARDTTFKALLGPQADGRRHLSVETPSLGKVLRTAGVMEEMRGGKLSITAVSEPKDPRTLFGHIKLSDYRMVNMPALAKLLSAISPDGLAALLGGSALHFAELNGEFMWKDDLIVINKASTSTGSLGMTTAGKIDLADNSINLEGQLIPVYFLSKIISSIPVIGDILAGGEGGGVFAATYGVKGKLAKPDVSVNPVSVLAPGILRNILFMDNKITEDDMPEETPAKAP